LPRVLLIGVDAADEAMIAPLMKEGRLPGLKRFYEQGVTGSLRSHKPLLSPILWTSIATGVSPRDHGVLGFIDFDRSGQPVPIGSGARRAASFWEAVGETGVRVAVVGWLATFPASPVNGWLVSDRVTVHPFEPIDGKPASDPAGKTFPPELMSEVSELAVLPSTVGPGDLQEDFGLSGSAVASLGADLRALQVVSATTRTHAAVGEHLLRTRHPDLTVVYFDGLDRLLHLFADLSDPPLPGSDPARARRLGRVGEHFCETIDRAVSRLCEAAGPEATVIVVSDHGWKTGPDRPVRDPRREGPFAAHWHREAGVLLARGRGVAVGGRIEGADIYDVAPTILAMYGLPPARRFRGRALGELFEPGFLPASGPPIEAYGPPRGAGAPGQRSPARASEDDAALENLRGLGYIGGASNREDRETAPRDRRRANLATVLLEEKEYEEAARIYREFLRDSPGDYDALFNLAFALRETGDVEGARTTYRLAALARPVSASPWIALAEMEMKDKRWREAWEAIGKAAVIEPSRAKIWNYRGAIACELGLIDEGIRAFERAIAIQPALPGPYLNLARVLEAAGRRTEAVKVLRRGLEASPSDERLTARLAALNARKAS
jgi:predicted AlkP superfamily phosphohydrolase/phosphomutase/Flp pilus assembly protein TadD